MNEQPLTADEIAALIHRAEKDGDHGYTVALRQLQAQAAELAVLRRQVEDMRGADVPVAPRGRQGVRRKRGDIFPGSAAGRLLEAAAALQQPFGLSALVLVAWKTYPLLFGLPGAEYIAPSDNRVKTLLYGKRGLIGRGLIRKAPGGLYEVAAVATVR